MDAADVPCHASVAPRCCLSAFQQSTPVVKLSDVQLSDTACKHDVPFSLLPAALLPVRMHCSCAVSAFEVVLMQVMIAQQESIAQLMGVYEDIRGRVDTGCEQNMDAYLEQEQHADALQQEHKQGKRHLKNDRSVSLPGSAANAACFTSSRLVSKACTADTLCFS